MIYTRNQINKAGDNLIGQDPFKRQEAAEIVSRWRETHLLALRELNDELTDLLSRYGIPFEFSSQRIKRMPSIIEKLKNNKEHGMKLGGLQDIGGVRFVFPGMAELDSFNEILKDFKPRNFELKKNDNYIENPKESGYRSIHYVYKYKSENKDYDGLQIELQIRTKIQHCWAMAVETASLISRTSLKAEIDDNSIWRDFFKLVSAIFAKNENKPIHPKFSEYTEEMYCNDYFRYTEEHKLLEQLKALRVTINFEKHRKIENGYCVLIIDFNKKIVHFQYYGTEEEMDASNIFTKLEQSITADEAALMVSMEKIEEIRRAYPSYFLDTKAFLDAIYDFDKKCQVYK